MDIDLDREVIRCKTCGLVQYRTHTGNCRRCLRLLPPKVEFLIPPLPAAARLGAVAVDSEEAGRDQRPRREQCQRSVAAVGAASAGPDGAVRAAAASFRRVWPSLRRPSNFCCVGAARTFLPWKVRAVTFLMLRCGTPPPAARNSPGPQSRPISGRVPASGLREAFQFFPARVPTPQAEDNEKRKSCAARAC